MVVCAFCALLWIDSIVFPLVQLLIGISKMSTELQSRAKSFLKRTIPAGVHYVPNSIAERFIKSYAQEGQLPDDAETMELLGLAAMETCSMIDQLKDPAALDYFRESSAILESMLAERI